MRPGRLPECLAEVLDIHLRELEWADLTPAEIAREEWLKFARVRKRAFLTEERRAKSNTQKLALWKIESQRLEKLWWAERHPETAA